ncbi:hypothetical protein [Candidatus Albibeggiatoa sp. nov. BB20]|uniref:hypothetical protein n=1 Tax=Candidatus Albibeggiatoa sp. nov. BB20 TaxID=3162723 RepID=UPI0033656620
MTLDSDGLGYKAMVILLKTAQKFQLPVTVNVVDDTDHEFCRLNWMINHKKPAG